MLANPKQFLASLPNKPGVYQMYDIKHQVLYVGKAKNLKKRVSSYFRKSGHPKTAAFMVQTHSIEVIVTPDENAALLLESNLIKDKKPRYNILFKDDKSFPYIFLSKHEFPRISVHRGATNKQGKYFGPFPDAHAVNFIMDLLQKIFRLRVCKDSFMKNRSRPCMLYQIKLCSAPCVGHIDQQKYLLETRLAEQFLYGKSDYIIKKLTSLMDKASFELAYEQAAIYREQITSIRRIQTQQVINRVKGNYDVLALVGFARGVCINMLFVRNGQVLGSKAYFPKIYDYTLSPSEILEAFITHHYIHNSDPRMLPDKILTNIKSAQFVNLSKILTEKAGRKILIADNVRGAYASLLKISKDNAENAIKSRASTTTYSASWARLKDLLGLVEVQKQIECFDVSHTMGEAQIAACVVFDQDGPLKKHYRRFNIKSANAGDDYGSLMETLTRRYTKVTAIPDIIMIDGGLGQLKIASKVMGSLNLRPHALLAIAKGEGRKPGLEKIYLYGKKEPLRLKPQDPVLHLIQQIRDEAHRFAITGHRKRMRKTRSRSVLENIQGIGKSKRTELLKHFGGIQELERAGIDELSKVKGISKKLAIAIYEHLHA